MKPFPVSMRTIPVQSFIDRNKKNINHHHTAQLSKPIHVSFNGNTMLNTGIDRSYGDQYFDDEPSKPELSNVKRKLSINNSNNQRNLTQNIKIPTRYTAVGTKRSLHYRKFNNPQVVEVKQEVSK
jgi:hypothetical protein